MGIIGWNGNAAGYKKAASYNTESDISSGGVWLYGSSIGPTGGYADIQSRDWGRGGKRLNNARGAASFDFNYTADWTFYQGWLGLFAGVMGTESTPAEQTVGQGDYKVNIDCADYTTGVYYTIGYSVEDDQILVVPSFSPQSATLDIALNGQGSVQIGGIADQVLPSSTNTVSGIQALPTYPYEEVTMGGANQYARFGNYSTSVALSSSNNIDIQGFTFSLNRAKERRYGFRAAQSQFTKEPLQPGLIDATLTLKLSELNRAAFDVLGIWQTPGYKMVEIYLDGSQIGSGLRNSYKLQFPSIKVKGRLPDGITVTSNSGLYSPSLTFDCFKAAAAPAGMTGVTEICRLVAVGPQRTTKWGT